jgi:hypothetical protein
VALGLSTGAFYAALRPRAFRADGKEVIAVD